MASELECGMLRINVSSFFGGGAVETVIGGELGDPQKNYSCLLMIRSMSFLWLHFV